MSEIEEPDYLFKQADRCKTVANTATDPLMRKALLEMAKEYEERASALLTKQKPAQGSAR